MQLRRRRYQENGRFYSVFRVELEPEELEALDRANLRTFKIQRHAGTIVGSSINAIGIANALQAQVNRLRNRWSVALARTTGSILLDLLLLYLRLFRDIFLFFLKVIFGTRQSFGQLLDGVKYSAKRIEDLKEIETFVLVSIAAVHEALRYAMDLDRDDVFEHNAYRTEIPGLTFADSLATSATSPSGDLNSSLPDLMANIDEEVVDDLVGAIADAV
jgi:hypothetical protein